jgi:hypothetical protein
MDTSMRGSASLLPYSSFVHLKNEIENPILYEGNRVLSESGFLRYESYWYQSLSMGCLVSRVDHSYRGVQLMLQHHIRFEYQFLMTQIQNLKIFMFSSCNFGYKICVQKTELVAIICDQSHCSKRWQICICAIKIGSQILCNFVTLAALPGTYWLLQTNWR